MIRGKGQFIRQDIVTALTANEGHVEAAFDELRRPPPELPPPPVPDEPNTPVDGNVIFKMKSLFNHFNILSLICVSQLKKRIEIYDDDDLRLQFLTPTNQSRKSLMNHRFLILSMRITNRVRLTH